MPAPTHPTSLPAAGETIWHYGQSEGWPYTYLVRDGVGRCIFSIEPDAFSSSDTQQQVNARPENHVLQRRLQAIVRLPNVVRACVKTMRVLKDLLAEDGEDNLSPWTATDLTRLAEEVRTALSGIDVDCL